MYNNNNKKKKNNKYVYIYKARLAQMVERMTLNHVVVGSSPTVGAFFYFLFFFYLILFN